MTATKMRYYVICAKILRQEYDARRILDYGFAFYNPIIW